VTDPHSIQSPLPGIPSPVEGHDAFGRSPGAGLRDGGGQHGRPGNPVRSWVAGAVAAAVFGAGGFLVVRAAFGRAQAAGPSAGPGGAQRARGFGGGPAFGGGPGSANAGGFPPGAAGGAQGPPGGGQSGPGGQGRPGSSGA
jgi:hypothetical protein